MGHLDSLNPFQKEAAMHADGPLLVLAGAGAGKTRVIAHRILELVRRGAAPSSIVAITFTNKAAREMRERTLRLLNTSPELNLPAFEPAAGPFISTFHSLGLFIIKEHFRSFGFKRLPAVWDRADSLRALKKILKDLGAAEELEACAALAAISRAKGAGITLGEFSESARNSRERLIAAVWERYERELASEQSLDFDDLLLKAVRFLSKEEAVRERYRARWRYVHIDEYQDTNEVQAALMKLLVGPERNVCAVGDLDQCIYTWRGAEIKNILSFEKEFPGAKVVVLEENYRSTGNILAAANDIIGKNQYRVEKHMFTKNAEGEKLSLYQAFDETDEAAYVARTIQERVSEGARPRDFAALYRANFQSRALEEALLTAGIPYQVLGTRFFERAEVKDAISYIRAALFGTSADVARIANSPRRGIGKTTLLALLTGAEERLSPALRAKILDFKGLLERIAEAARALPPSKLVQFVIQESGMEREYRADKVEGEERLENLKELAALASRFDMMPPGEGVQMLLEQAALGNEQDELKDEADAVRLMTVHASKGLEFPYVFITGLEEGLFPHEREGEEKEDDEEERRLMYVAVTRAERKVFLTYAMSRSAFGSRTMSAPSHFLSDISPDLVELEAPERLGKTIYLD